MSILEIVRLTTSVTVDATTLTGHEPQPDGGPEAWARGFGAGVAEAAADGLASAWEHADVRAGLWCVRRLDLRIDIDGPDARGQLSRLWVPLLMAEVARALDASADVVHYNNEVAAVADTVHRLSIGDHTRSWAAEMLGLTRPGDGPGPGDAVLAVLARRPETALAAVTEVVRLDVAALDRILGPEGWTGLARITWQAAGDARTAMPLDPSVAGPTHGRPGIELEASAGDLTPEHAAATDSAGLFSGLLRLPRPAAPTLDAWAVLIALAVDPAVAGRSDAARRVAAVRDVLTPHRSSHPLAATHRPSPATPGPGSAATRNGPSERGPRADGEPLRASPDERATPRHPAPGREAPHDEAASLAAPTESRSASTARQASDLRLGGAERSFDGPDGSAGAGSAPTTSWAGLTFLLNAAPDIQLPARLVAQDCCADRPIWWVMHALAGMLCEAPEDDPGRLALAGAGSWRQADLRRMPPPDPAERAVLSDIALAWGTALVARLGGSPGPVRREVTRVAHRPGRVVAVPGWIELHLPLDGVDLDIRRAGLDTDPGWIPWLGAVVRHVYE